MVCTTPFGIGANHTWYARVGGQTSEFWTTTTSAAYATAPALSRYARPEITAVRVRRAPDSGAVADGAARIPTVGGGGHTVGGAFDSYSQWFRGDFRIAR